MGYNRLTKPRPDDHMAKTAFNLPIIRYPYQDVLNLLTLMIYRHALLHPVDTDSSLISTRRTHYCDVMMDTVASQITSLTVAHSTVYWDADQRKHQSSASLAFMRGIHRGPVNSPHKWPVTRKMFPLDDVIMKWIAWKPDGTWCGISGLKYDCSWRRWS